MALEKVIQVFLQVSKKTSKKLKKLYILTGENLT